MKKHINLGHTYIGKYQVEQGRYFYRSFDWKAIAISGVHISKIYIDFEYKEKKRKEKKEKGTSIAVKR